MRSSIRPAVIVAALALSGCGNYSTEDLRFLAALPQREDLTFEVPAGRPGALTACPPANASVWLEAKPTADKINAGVDLLLSLVDTVRRLPPTWRSDDARMWGPFDDEGHPGRELRVVMERSFPSDLAGEARYAYAFQARVKGTAAWTNVIVGAFNGGSASRGDGGVVLDFDAMRAVGIDDEGTPAGNMQIAYDRTGDPVTLQLLLTSDGFGAVQFGYRSAKWAAGGGVFDFAIRDANGNLLVIATRYDAAGAGRAGVAFQAAGQTSVTGGYEQCWGANACLVYVNDPANLSCQPVLPETSCNYGDALDCPAPLPESPFP
jgi:hypothetical protein